MKILLSIFGEYFKLLKGAKFDYDQMKEENVIRNWNFHFFVSGHLNKFHSEEHWTSNPNFTDKCLVRSLLMIDRGIKIVKLRTVNEKLCTQTLELTNHIAPQCSHDIIGN